MRLLGLILGLTLAISTAEARTFKYTVLNVKVTYSNISTGTTELASNSMEVRYSSDQKFCIVKFLDQQLNCRIARTLSNNRFRYDAYLPMEGVSDLLRLIIESSEKSGDENLQKLKERVLELANTGETPTELKVSLDYRSKKQFHDDIQPDSAHLHISLFSSGDL